jgi:hypothetical protein
MVLRRVGLFCNIVRMALGSRLVVVLLGFGLMGGGEVDSVGGVEGFIVLGGVDDEAVAVDGAVFDVVLREVSVFSEENTLGGGLVGVVVEVLDKLVEAPTGGAGEGIGDFGLFHLVEVFTKSE